MDGLLHQAVTDLTVKRDRKLAVVRFTDGCSKPEENLIRKPSLPINEVADEEKDVLQRSKERNSFKANARTAARSASVGPTANHNGFSSADNAASFEFDGTFCGMKRKRLRIVVLGARGVGKTSIIEQFVHGPPKQHVACSKLSNYYPIVFFNDNMYDIQITECPSFVCNFPKSGEDDFVYFRGYGLLNASCYILVYDVTNSESFEYVRVLHQQIQNFLQVTSNHQKSLAKVGKIFGTMSGAMHAGSTDQLQIRTSGAHKSDSLYCGATSIVVVGNKVDLTMDLEANQQTKPTLKTQTSNSKSEELTANIMKTNGSKKHNCVPFGLNLGKGLSGKPTQPGDAVATRKAKSEMEAPTLSALFSAHQWAVQNTMLVPKLLVPAGGGCCASASSGGSAMHHPRMGNRSSLLDHAAFVKKYWKATHIEVSAKFNWHVSHLFKEAIRQIDESENRMANGKSHNSMRLRLRCSFFKRPKND